MKFLSLIASIVTGGACLILAACATDESINREATVQLEPYDVEAPPSVGDEIHGFDKGEPTTAKVVAIEGDLITYKNIAGPMEGCSWTRGIEEDRFAPAVAWENCRNGSTGTQTYTKSGNIWPLAVGNSESYEVSGKDQKYDWTTTRNCVVEAAVMVSVQGKQIPAYEVVCRDEWNKHYWYISPELGKTVKYKKIHHERGIDNDWFVAL